MSRQPSRIHPSNLLKLGMKIYSYNDTGEFQEKRLTHRDEAEEFYRALAGQKVRMGMEASGHARWFERLVAELQLPQARSTCDVTDTARSPPADKVQPLRL